MTGKSFSKDERKIAFCVAAKTCAGKVKSREEAIRVCSAPKPPKPMKLGKKGKGKGQNCEKQAMKLSQCMAENMDLNELSGANINSMPVMFATALHSCLCGGTK